MATFIDPDEVKQEEAPKASFVDPDTIKDPDAVEPKSFISKVGENLGTTLKSTANTATDLADLVLSTPAWLGGMAAGLVAAEVHSTDITQSGSPGEHFGAAHAVKEGIMEAYGSPIRRGLTAVGVMDKSTEGEATSPVAGVMGKVGEALHAVETKTTEVTGSKEAGKATSFLTEMLAPSFIHAAAKGVYVGGKKIADSVVTTPEVKAIDPAYAESKIKPEETITDVIQRKYERDALAKKLDEGEATMGELPKPVEGEVPVETVAEVKATPTKPQSEQVVLQAKDHPEIMSSMIKELNETAYVISAEPGRFVLDMGKGLTVEVSGNYSKFKGPQIDALPQGHPFRDSFNINSAETGIPGWWNMTQAGLKNKPVVKPQKIKEEVTGRTADTALAHTDKDGIVTLNNAKIEADFKAGFPYIFDASTETGKQKAAVFEQINVTKEDFAKAVPDVATYKDFLKAHEESHVRNGDRVAYPRTPEGKADLMHPDAIKIEARATLDALKAINKESPADAVTANVYSFITKEAIEHPASIEGASKVIEKSLNAITAESRLVDIRVKGILEAVPDAKVRDLMTRNLEKERKFDQIPRDQTKAIELNKELKTYFEDLGNKARQAGLLNELRSNYVPHVLDFSKNKLSPKETTDLLSKIANAPKDSKLVRDFTQERKFEFLRELEKVVAGTGIVVHTDIAKIVEAYGKAMQTAIIQKSMLDFLKANKGPDGHPWLLPDDAVSKGLKYVPFEAVGSKALDGLRVHPDLVDSMGFMFRERDPHILIRALGGISHLTKAVNVVGSLFHMKSLAEAGFLTSPSLFLKEVFTAGSGMKAALRAFEHEGANPVVDLLIREGGLMIKVEDVSRTIVADTGVFLDSAATKLASKAQFLKEGQELKLTQHITDPFDKIVLQRMNTWTWDYMHTAQKLNVATHLFNKMKLKNPELPDAQVAREVSAYVNNTFGGINWLQVANQVHNKTLRALSLKMAGIAGREWAQVVMFAPDWTVSTLRAFTTALPKELAKPQNWELRKGVAGVVNPRTQGDLARRYVVATAIAWLTILDGINLAVSDHHLWENRDPTRIDLGDGTSMQAAKHSMEAAHWLMHPDKTLGNKLGFWPKALFVSTTATAYPSPDAPKLKDTSFLGRAKAVGLLGMPFAVSSATQAPEGQGAKRALLSTLGMPVYGVSKTELKKSQAKGRLEAKKKKIEEKRNK